MMSFDFQTTTHGKWILAGEHAVLRGHAALVFPIPGKTLTLSYRASNAGLSAEYDGENSSDIHMLFWSVLEQGQQLLGRSLSDLHGHFHLYNDIPIGVGMGASAALCVAVARWFMSQSMLHQDNLFSFARDLENLFHGKSSGLDIAGVSAGAGVKFQNGHITALEQRWQPHWFLSSCGQIGITSHCIKQVQDLWLLNPENTALIDVEMNDSVEKAQLALKETNSTAINQLAEAINQAAHCFRKWGLISENLQQHMQKLLDAGAMAVKPTGSGGGGYVLSLWREKPSAILDLIAV